MRAYGRKDKEKEENSNIQCNCINIVYAFEAAEQAADAHISVKINRKDNYINILISNTCSPDMGNFGGRLMTTKKDADLHGYGIANVKDIINRNYGLYEYTVKDGMFTTNVLMHV